MLTLLSNVNSGATEQFYLWVAMVYLVSLGVNIDFKGIFKISIYSKFRNLGPAGLSALFAAPECHIVLPIHFSKKNV